MPTRTIVIKNLDAVKTGPRKDGKGNWTLSEVKAEKEDGTPITEKLKTFSEFEIGKPIEVELEKQEHEVYGVSYLVKPVGRYATRDELKLLVERVNDLEEAINAPQNGSQSVSEGTESDDDPSTIPF